MENRMGILNSLTPERRPIRSFVYTIMQPQNLTKSFDGEIAMFIRMLAFATNPLFGSIKFQLDKPLSQYPRFYLKSLNRVVDLKLQKRFNHSLSDISHQKFECKYQSDLPDDFFNSRGVPGKTVETLVSLLEGLHETLTADS